jgi:4-hydroxybenzoate polyprenyltransferase
MQKCMMNNYFYSYLKLARLDKPAGILLLLWPTIWALIISSEGEIILQDLLIFCIGVILTRSAGCVINDIFDRDIDSKVKRTSNRPLAQKELTINNASIFFLFLSLGALSLLFFLHSYALKIICISAFLLMVYPLSKRFFPIPQFFLGLAFSSSVLVVFAHIQQSLPLESWILFFLNFSWVMAYDTVYAKADFADDINLNIHSSPKLFKKYTNHAIVVFYLAFLTLYAILIKEDPCFIAYFLIVTFMIGKMVHELFFGITQDNDYINLFKKNNYLGIIVTFMFLLSHTWIF